MKSTNTKIKTAKTTNSHGPKIPKGMETSASDEKRIMELGTYNGELEYGVICNNVLLPFTKEQAATLLMEMFNKDCVTIKITSRDVISDEESNISIVNMGGILSQLANMVDATRLK